MQKAKDKNNSCDSHVAGIIHDSDVIVEYKDIELYSQCV